MSDTGTVDERAGELWSELDGSGFIAKLASGEIPRGPHAELLGYAIEQVSPGRIVMRWEVPDALINPAGIAHGGFLVALLDDAAGLAAASRYPRFVPQLTLELRSDFLRPAEPGVRYEVIGEVVRGGRSSNLCDARLRGPSGEIVARTTGTFLPNRRAIPGHRWEEAGIAP